MKFFRPIFFAVLFCFCLQSVQAQEGYLANEIKDYKKADSAVFPAKHAIVFTGSSSFRLWDNVENYFPGYTIINRGFGGSTLPDVIRYADQIIFPYQPKQIVIYCGDNDLASSDTITAQTVLGRFQQLFSLIRSRMPKVDVAYVSIKPSPSRAHLIPKVKEANNLIKTYLEKQKNAHFINIYDPMLDGNGNFREELYLADRLHMKPAGYAIWQKAIQPYLLK